MSSFTEELKKARESKNMTKTQVAKLFGWTPMYYGRYENGYLTPTKYNLNLFANFMGMAVEELKELLDKDDLKNN